MNDLPLFAISSNEHMMISKARRAEENREMELAFDTRTHTDTLFFWAFRTCLAIHLYKCIMKEKNKQTRKQTID